MLEEWLKVKKQRERKNLRQRVAVITSSVCLVALLAAELLLREWEGVIGGEHNCQELVVAWLPDGLRNGKQDQLFHHAGDFYSSFLSIGQGVRNSFGTLASPLQTYGWTPSF